jgi:DNA repair exonuclease SbcCD ATPase subunit
MSQHQHQLKRLQDANEDAQATMHSLKRKIASQLDTLSTQEKIIAGKDASLHAVRARIGELEKLKFVLSERIKDIEANVGPKDVVIVKLKEQIKRMGEDLQLCHQRSKSLNEHIEALKARHSDMHSELSVAKAHSVHTQFRIAGFQRELAAAAAGDLSDSVYLKTCLADLAGNHKLNHYNQPLQVTDGGGDTQGVEGDEKISMEVQDQSQYLTRVMHSLQIKQAQDYNAEVEAIQKGVITNSALIVEIDSIRHSLVTLRNDWHRLKVATSKMNKQVVSP